MKSTTIDCVMSLRRRSSSSSGVSTFSTAGEAGGSAGNLSERESGVVDSAEPTCAPMALERAEASAPVMRFSKV
jgi:hypothetical protein